MKAITIILVMFTLISCGNVDESEIRFVGRYKMIADSIMCKEVPVLCRQEIELELKGNGCFTITESPLFCYDDSGRWSYELEQWSHLELDFGLMSSNPKQGIRWELNKMDTLIFYSVICVKDSISGRFGGFNEVKFIKQK
ncbi:MAG: hypothetical protein ACO3EE_02860 [Flavobacteriales bacterium]